MSEERSLSARVQAFEASVADWPTWRKLAVFTPVLLLVSVPVVALIVAIGAALVHGHH
jgi:uncharacterized protein (DUF983 family)